MMSANKILVVGAGIAGTAVCYWLKRFGFAPVLIERSANMRKGGQALDIRGAAIDIVKKMGIYEKIYHMRTRVEFGRYVDELGNVIHEEMGERAGFRQGEEVEILRGDLIELMSTILDTPCQYSRMIGDIKQHDDMVEVHFKDGQKDYYDLVIGADGIYSQIRRIAFDKNEYDLLSLGVYLSIFSIPNYLNLSHAELWCEKNQKMVSLISDQDPNTARAAFMLRSQQLLNNIRDEKEQQQFLFDNFQDFGWEVPNILARFSDKSDLYFDLAQQVKMASWSKGRIVLLGDAGYCASPLSGQGNNLALVGAYILAGELKKAQGNYMTAFARYNDLLGPFIKANQDFGLWVSESFLANAEVSQEVAKKRSDNILKKMKSVANAISLPDYTG